MRLFYFTNSYPFGVGEQWKTNELKELVHHFDQVTVIPFSYGGNTSNPKTLPTGASLLGPLFATDVIKLQKSDFLKIFFSRHLAEFMREFFARKVYKNRHHVVSWVLACLNVNRLLKHPVVRKVLLEADAQTVMYFYWGRGACEILPFISTRRFFKTFVRMHRYDLFEDENRGYLPFRGRLLDAITIAAPSSEVGRKYLLKLYPEAKARIDVVRCGTIGNGKLTAYSTDKTLRVVSCSFLSKVKRIDLMIEAVSLLDFPIFWQHIGDGPLMESLKARVRELGLERKFVFLGQFDSRTILDFYTSNTLDVFVNTSKSEGVPFSIMEAFSVALPVVATNVGGTGEIVDNAAGILLSPDPSPSDIARELSSFYNKTQAERASLGKEAFRRYKQYWDAEKLAKELALLLKA